MDCYDEQLCNNGNTLCSCGGCVCCTPSDACPICNATWAHARWFVQNCSGTGRDLLQKEIERLEKNPEKLSSSTIERQSQKLTTDLEKLELEKGFQLTLTEEMVRHLLHHPP
jgi:hypothetical protein